jgi:hypothetical protein
MASKAFTAVARSVHTVIKDPDDETESRRLCGTPKNNLGRTDLLVMSLTIIGWTFDTDDGPASTGQLVWGDDVDGTIAEALCRANDDPENRTATGDAAAWLDDYLTVHGPKVASADIKRDATAAGHNVEALKRARCKLQIAVVNEGFPRITFWLRQSGQPARGDTLTDPTNPTGHNGYRSGQSGQSEHTGVLVTQLWPRTDVPICLDCGWPVDTVGHETTCEVPALPAAAWWSCLAGQVESRDPRGRFAEPGIPHVHRDAVRSGGRWLCRPRVTSAGCTCRCSSCRAVGGTRRCRRVCRRTPARP